MTIAITRFAKVGIFGDSTGARAALIKELGQRHRRLLIGYLNF
jgi:hypothetical protein